MTSPEAVPMRLAAPDPAFRLTVEDRAAVAPVFDADALERLLAEIRPDMRREMLAYFQIGKSDGHLVQIFDPHLQALLEEVRAAYWDNAPDQAIEEDWYRVPGRQIAKARRAAARARGLPPGRRRGDAGTVPR